MAWSTGDLLPVLLGGVDVHLDGVRKLGQVEEDPSTFLRGPELRPSSSPRAPCLLCCPFPRPRWCSHPGTHSFPWAKPTPLPSVPGCLPGRGLKRPSTPVRQKGFFLWLFEMQRGSLFFGSRLGGGVSTAQASGPSASAQAWGKGVLRLYFSPFSPGPTPCPAVVFQS